MHVTYIRPFSGQEFIFETQINNLGRMMVRATCAARDSITGKVLATAMATFIPVKTK
jgi:acyl-coenzyme A thioesterase PaaI-like protein